MLMHRSTGGGSRAEVGVPVLPWDNQGSQHGDQSRRHVLSPRLGSGLGLLELDSQKEAEGPFGRGVSMHGE